MAQLGLVLLLLPLVLIGLAATYESRVTEGEREALARAAASIAATDEAHGAARTQIAVRAHALVARIDARGEVVERIGGAGVPLESSALGAVGERLFAGRVQDHSLERADAALPPWSARDEVRAALAGRRAFGSYLTPAGDARLVTLAEPLPGGGVRYLITGSHRGIRRLAVARRQLAQLFLYEVVLATPLVLLFAWRIIRPLERLARAARRYPAAPLADAKLVARTDEIGALSRTLARMADDLDARRRAAADLGADIAHEFKNPLATIAASAELLTSTTPPTPERLRLVSDTIGASVERLRRSIDDLLGLLRLEQALPDEAREPTPLGPFLRSVADEYARDPRTDGWWFDVQAAPDVAALAPALNRARFTELLRNLIENALVQPTTDKRIVLSARREAGELVLSVRDHGPGISAENQARIFTRFFTQRPEGTPPGTGLGLSIVDSVARAHGGRVAVRSEPSKGAEFLVILPL
jgi:two-component system sensor histidine kinase ChvG